MTILSPLSSALPAIVAAFAMYMAVAVPVVQAQCAGILTCQARTTSPPKLDGDFRDWALVSGISTPLYSYFGNQYEGGNGNYKCAYDSSKIYFALEFPGKYSFNSSGNHQSPAIGTMTKIGVKATYINMGGCPEGQGRCNNSVPFPSSCDNYIVDLGAHWQTRTTLQGVEYPISNNGTGRDATSRKDDEYAVGPTCRRPDDGPNAANEWTGAWTHTANSTIGAAGFYRFELSRLLSTPSSRTDAQFAPGNNYSFGIAFWDPFESDVGWTDAGHYLTGCGFQWITLALVGAPPNTSPATKPPTSNNSPKAPTKKPLSSSSTKPPTKKPTKRPTTKPSKAPTKKPTKPPTKKPVNSPTK